MLILNNDSVEIGYRNDPTFCMTNFGMGSNHQPQGACGHLMFLYVSAFFNEESHIISENPGLPGI